MQRLYHLILGLIIISLVASTVLAADNSGDSISQQVISQVPPLVANLPGTEIQLLPKNFDIWSCDWSPDGKALVFSGKLQGEDSAKMRIWYWSLDPASDPQPLTNTDQFIDFSPRWSPDGTKILMSRRNFPVKAGNTSAGSCIWLKELPSGNGKQLSTGPEDRDPFWSPDGTQMVFSRGKGPYRGQLYVTNMNDGASRLLSGQEGELLTSPYWGRDGIVYYTKLTPSPKTVVVAGQKYEVMDFGKGSIWSVNPVTNVTAPVINDEYDNRLPALSPDGQRLAFVSNRVTTKEGNGKFDRGGLFIKKLNSGEIYFITNKVGLNGGSLSWSPDGKKLAFFTFRSIRPSIWVMNLP
jgi:Periplasmic component of the Tol biopolymer transport system